MRRKAETLKPNSLIIESKVSGVPEKSSMLLGHLPSRSKIQEGHATVRWPAASLCKHHLSALN